MPKAEATEAGKKGTKAAPKIPHIFVILFLFIALMAVLTYIVPAGIYDRVPVEGTSRMMIDPTSYHTVERTPVGLLDLFVAIPQGFVEAGWVVVLTFCVGGAFMVLKETGAIAVGVDALAHKMSKRGILIIPILMALFATIDAFIGMPELCMVYVPVILPLMLVLGFDSITAAATALIGSAAGFTAALTNPFTVAIAQKIAGLPLYSGINFRLITLITTLIIGIVFVMRYAMKVRKDPESSSMYEIDEPRRKALLEAEEEEKGHVSKKVKLAGAAAVIIFLILIWGVLKYKWDMPQIGGIFIAMAVVCGLLGGLSSRQLSESFLKGCHDVLIGALIIGIARGVAVVMVQGQIMDTIVFGLANVVKALPGTVTSVGMLVVQSLFNFLVPSGSGQTLITMPIMAPLADIVGVTRQTAVLALQYGDGISNIFYPTSGYFMASLALAGVPWEKWAKFMLPLFGIWSATGAFFLIISQLIQWGPF
ncbi:MAG: YfcC family protein [Sediminispirochaetaceae bacterium]